MAVGDEVYLWKAHGKPKGFAGIVGHGTIVEPPTHKASVAMPENLGDEFFINGATEKSEIKVRVNLDRVAKKIEDALLRENLVSDDLFKNSQIIKTKQGTIFQISRSQAARLRELWNLPQVQLASVQCALENDGKFEANDEPDAREKVLRSIALRHGQPRFRKALLSAYGRKCAVTGTCIEDVLEAAHIVPYNGKSTNHIRNGLLLRSDIHDLFDLGLLSIDPQTHTIYCSEGIRGEVIYRGLHGQKITRPVNPREGPDSKALQIHFDKRII